MGKRKRMAEILAGVILGLAVVTGPVLAAPLFNVPTTVTQPDGGVLELYSSGDEYFNYLHDGQGRLIMRDGQGRYVYAQEEDGMPVPSDQAVPADGDLIPFAEVRGMTVGEIDFAAHPELLHEYPRPEEAAAAEDEELELQGSVTEPVSKVAPKMANLVIFIRFQGEEEFVTGDMALQNPKAAVPADVQSQSGLTEIDFGDSYTKVSTYMDKVSNGLFDIDTTFLTADESGQTICSYEDIYPRSYYEPFSESNPNGVNGGGEDRFYREMYLLERALMATGDSLQYAGWPELDYDGDGKIDNITFIVSGSTSGWSDLLWPHSWALQLDKLSMNSGAPDGPFKLAYQFNFNFANPRYAGVGVLSHELLHSVGYPDLYRYDYSGDPVGQWDAMATTDYADPQFLGAYLKEAYAGWGRIGEITTSGTYTLYPIGTEEDSSGEAPLEGYRIPTDVMGEYIYVEYRKSGTYGDVTQDNVPRDGLLVYRANRKTVDGNRNGTVDGGDEVYVFRPGDSAPNAGTPGELKKAALSPAYDYTSIGGSKGSGLAPEETLYYNSGENTGIVVDQVTERDDGTISFRVTLPHAPNSIAPGRYNVEDSAMEGDSWYIDQPGDYTFYGSSTQRQIVVALNTQNVHITLEDLSLDLSKSEGRAPIVLRGGSQVEITMTGRAALAGGQYVPAIQVEEDARVTVTGPGALEAAGGPGAPAIGGSAFTTGGSIALKDLSAILTGGEAFKLYNGSSLVMVSYGSSALGSGSQQTSQGITIENCDLTVQGGSSIHSIATSWTYGGSAYAPGGDIVIRDSQITASGAILAGPQLTVEGSTITLWADGDRYDGSALTATEKLTLTDCRTRLEASQIDAVMNKQTERCEVAIQGGSLWGFANSSGIHGRRIAISSNAQIMLASVNAHELLQGDGSQGDDGAVLIPGPDGTQATLIQGTFTAGLDATELVALTDGKGYRSYVELPKKARTILLSVPGQGEYTLIDNREAQCSGLKATAALSRVEGLSFREQTTGKIAIELEKGSQTIAKSGSYVVTGTHPGATLTVAPNVTATIYLSGVDLTGPAGQSALSIGAGATVRVVAYNRSSNLLRGGGNAPALAAGSGSAVTVTGTGTLLTTAAGAPAVTAYALAVDQSVGFTALSDQTAAVSRQAGAWKPSDGAEPTIVYGRLSQPLEADVGLTFAGPLALLRAEAPAGTCSFLYNLGQRDTVRLRTTDGRVSSEVACLGEETDAGVLILTREEWVTMTLDLSKDSYVITQNGTYTVIGTTDVNTVRVAPNVSATLILQQVNADLRSSLDVVKRPNGIIELGSNCAVVVEVPQGTRSSLAVNLTDQQYVSAIYVPASARLTLRGQGALYLQGGSYGVALGAADRVTAGEIIVEGTELDLDCRGSAGVVLGGTAAKVTITGGKITSRYRYGGTIGGNGSTVVVSGGKLDLQGRQMDAALGGAGSHVTITGGEIAITLSVNHRGIGGQGSEVRIRGGKITAVEDASAQGLKYILGGDNAQIVMTGGSLEGEIHLRYGDYSGALGGEGAAASFSGDAQVLIRLLGKTATPLCNTELLRGQEGSFLEARFAQALDSADTITITPASGGSARQIALPQGAWGFFTLLPQGVYDMTNSAGGYGGAAGLTQAGVTKLEDVSFNRLRGVYFENVTIPYDGRTHTITVTGLTSSMGTVTYSDNSKREPGTYTAKAVVTPTGGSPYTLTATFTITKGKLTVTGVKANDKAVYDGTTATTGQVLYTGAASEAPQFRARFNFEDPNVGTNKKVQVTGITLDAQWAARYDLTYASGMGTTATTTASILAPAQARITIDGGSLYQLAGHVQPLVYTVQPEGLPCTVTYNGGAALPQTAGDYTAVVTVDNAQNPNYTGSATAAMVVANGIDLSQEGLTITQPGKYLVTGTTTVHNIQITASGTVDLYLSGVDIRLTASGASPISLGNKVTYLNIYALPGTENLLWGGTNAPAITSAGYGAVIFKGAGELTVLAGSGYSKAIETRSSVTGTPLVGSTLPWVQGEDVSAHNLVRTKWVVYSFAAAPTEDVLLTFWQEGYGSRQVTLPAGCRTLIVPAFKMFDGIRTQLRDQEGHVLSLATCPVVGDLYLYDVPYAYVEPQVQEIDISDYKQWPHKITASGIYHVVGNTNGLVGVTTATSDWKAVLEIGENLMVDLTFDNVTVHRCGMGPLVKLGAGSDVTIGVVGENILYNCWDSIFAEPFAGKGNACTGHLTLKDGTADGKAAAGSAQLIFGYFEEYDSEAKQGGDSYGVGAAIHVGGLEIQGGDWTVTALRKRDNAWCVRTYGNLNMTGGSLTLQGAVEKQDSTNTVVGNPAQDNELKRLGGLWVEGTARITGDSRLDIRTKSGTDSNEPHYYAGIYCGNASNPKSEWALILDGDAVKVTMDTTGSGGAVQAKTVELLRGSLDLSVRYVNNMGFREVEKLTLSPDFILNGCASYVNEDSTANDLFDKEKNLALQGTEDTQPVLLKCSVKDAIRPASKLSGLTLQVTSVEDPAFSRTIPFPTLYESSLKLDEYYYYQSFLLSLPGPGQYELCYYAQDKTQKTATVEVQAGYNEMTDVVFTSALAFRGLDLPDETFIWDGKTKSLTLTGTESKEFPAGAAVSYENNDQTEPGEYYVTVTVQAPGYQDWTKTAKLVIKKAALTVGAVQADDKEMYDGTTLTTGTVVLAGLVSGDDVTASATFRFDTPDVGSNKPVTVTDVDIQGWQDHYILDLTDAPLTTTASILNKAPVTITWSQPTLTQTYGSTLPVVASAVDPLTVGQTDSSGNLIPATALKVTVTYPGQSGRPALPGSYAVAAQVEDKNYEGKGESTLLIQPRPIAITGLQVPSIRQGDSLSLAITVDSASAQAFGVLAQDADGVTISCTAVYPDDTPGEKTVDIQEVTLTGAKAGYYRLEPAASGVGTVLAADAPILTSVTVTAPTKTSYQKGDSLDRTGMKVTAKYSDGSTKDITGEAICAPTQFTGTGTVTVTVSYQGQTASFTVTVADSSGGSGGGGGGGGGGSVQPAQPTTPEPAVPAGPQVVNTDPLPFVDLDQAAWAIPDITWCYQRGMVKGISQDQYSPMTAMTRAMFVTILGRMDGVDTAEYGSCTFQDVEPGSWYAPYVAWGEQTGLVKGRSAVEFAPNSLITRQEAAVLLTRYLEFHQITHTPESVAEPFTDGDQAGQWAAEGIEHMRLTGLMIGYPDGSFGPQDLLTRAQAATLFRRLCQICYPAV